MVAGFVAGWPEDRLPGTGRWNRLPVPVQLWPHCHPVTATARPRA